MDKLRILFVALYSDKYPAIGESHGTSVVAGSVLNKCSHLQIDYLEVIDMVILGDTNIENITETIKLKKPNIIGFSVNYGTYDILKLIIENTVEYINSFKPLILFGGPISTYIPEIIINNIYDKAIIVIGEGDETTPMLIDSWANNLPFKQIPNVCYKNDGTFIYTIRKLVEIENLSLPYRGHILAIKESKAQIYVESSRGCSWAACTFCLRGLTDVKGKKTEYRRFNIERLTSDILNLNTHGIRVFTMADEDFLGGNIKDNHIFVNKFEEFCVKNSLRLSFDASLTVNSIFSDKFSQIELTEIKYQLIKLKKIGLRKIFLGIESGSDSQLKRYVKGHSSYEILEAIKIIQDVGFDLELGFIMFDPLCTLDEIDENIDFLYNNDLTKYVSFLSNELRLQVKANYINVLEVYENRHKTTIYDRKIDYNTISHTYEYADKNINKLLNTIQFWNSRIRGIHYPLKNLSRYGEGGILGKYRNEVVNIIINLRNDYILLIKKEISIIKQGNVNHDTKKSISELLYNSSKRFIELSEKVPNEILDNEIFNKILKTCKEEINSYTSK